MLPPPAALQLQQLHLLAPADLGAMATLPGGSQPNLALLSPHGSCTLPALPRMSLSPCHPSAGTLRLSHQFSSPVEVQGYFILRERAMEGGNKIQ